MSDEKKQPIGTVGVNYEKFTEKRENDINVEKSNAIVVNNSDSLSGASNNRPTADAEGSTETPGTSVEGAGFDPSTGDTEHTEHNDTEHNEDDSFSQKVSDDLDAVNYNALINLLDENGKLQLGEDKVALKKYFESTINPRLVRFPSLRQKIDYLIDNDYYEAGVIERYNFSFVKRAFKRASSYSFRFNTYMGARKFFRSYAMTSFDGKKILETYEDRVTMVALTLGAGDEELALNLIDEMMSRRIQPATPTFLNAGKKQRGAMTSCFLLSVEDSLESIYRSVMDAAQLSKRGGGVALCVTDIRESGAPIKKMEGMSSGIIPVLKLYEDTFKYVNQLGQRQGAGAAYIHAHHPDIIAFLDTKKENADEATRIKTLSLGVVIPDITYELAKRGEDMYLFSPYDILREYGIPMSQMDITAMYDELVANPNIRKSTTNARNLFTHIASLQFESGYPYVLNVDNANRAHNLPGKISMSNLCSEILQSNEYSTFKENNEFNYVGKDISCNLASANIANMMNSEDFGKSVETAVRGLTYVVDTLGRDVSSSPSVVRGNESTHAIGLGQMNLHGFLAKNHIHYDSPEAVDFTRNYFHAVQYHAIKASNKIAKERGESFEAFKESKYYTGEFFEKRVNNCPTPETEIVRNLFEDSTVHLPTSQDWADLRDSVHEFGMYHGYLQAVAPTGSISYVNESTSSIHPIVAAIEARKEGKTGKTFVPMPYLSEDTIPYYRTAYEIDNKSIVNIYAAAQEYVDQGMSLTTFYKNTHTTRDIVKTLIYGWSRGIKTFYYARVKTANLEGTDVETANAFCESCQI